MILLDSSALIELVGETCLWLPATPDATLSLLIWFDFQGLMMVLVVMVIVIVRVGVVISMVISCMFIRFAAGSSLGRTLEDNSQASNQSYFNEALHLNFLSLSFNSVWNLGSKEVFKPFIVVSNNCATFMKV